MQHGRSLVALIGGAFKEDPLGSGNWRTMRIDEADYGIIGDELRCWATAALYHQNRAGTQVLVVGGVTPLHGTKPNAPHLASVIKKELMSLPRPVPEPFITELDIDPRAGTYEQLLSLHEAVNKQAHFDRVVVVSNRWHLPRVEAMIRFRGQLSVLNQGRVRLVGAEDVLIEDAPDRWMAPITDAYRSLAMRQILWRELNGAKMIADGTYQFPDTSPNR